MGNFPSASFFLLFLHLRTMPPRDVAHWQRLYSDSIRRVKGEVRAINDRNICERRSCMKNNGKSPTFKFVSGEERRPSEVQRVSRGWRHALVSGSHLNPKMTENASCRAVRAGKHRAWAWELLFRLRETSIGWDMSDSEETIWDPISS